MAKKRKSVKRRSPKSINLTNLAQGVVTANILSQGMFGVNPLEFLRGTQMSNRYSGQTYFAGYAQGQNAVSLQEILGMRSDQPSTKPVGMAIRENLMSNGLNMGIQLVGAKIGFKMFKQLARPALTPVRKALKGTGVTV